LNMLRITTNPIARLARFVTRRADSTAFHNVQIGNTNIGKMHPCFFVAEVGINHNGSMEIAKKLIDAASTAGAQAVKFQKRTIPVVYTQEGLAKSRSVDRGVLENAVARGVLSSEAVARLAKSDFKDSTNGDLKYALEFNEAEYRQLFGYANGKGLLAFASPWDPASVDFLERFNPPCHKVASASLTDDELLQRIRSKNRPVILSTGMSTMEQVRHAVSNLDTNKLVLLHTVSTYPAVDGDLNLKMIDKLRRAFPGIPVGYSGHEKGIQASMAAATVGAHVIERHITLDKNMFGTDQSASLEPQEFKDLISGVRLIEAAYGDGVKRVLDAEIPIISKLRRK